MLFILIAASINLCSFFYLLLGKLSRIFENQRKDCHWAKGTCWICKVGLHVKFETLIIAKILSLLPQLKGWRVLMENSGRVYCELPETLCQFSQRNAPSWENGVWWSFPLFYVLFFSLKVKCFVFDWLIFFSKFYFPRDVAAGMQYLESKHLVHRYMIWQIRDINKKHIILKLTRW